MSKTFVRLTVTCSDREFDVSLPTDAMVVEWLPQLVQMAGGDVTDAADPWTLSTPAGGPIPIEATLEQAAVLDGARVFLTRRADAAQAPFVDDVISAVEPKVSRQYTVWQGAVADRAVAAVGGVAVAAGALTLLMEVGPLATGVGAILLAVAALVAAAVLARGTSAPAAWGAIVAGGCAGYSLGGLHSSSVAVIALLAAVALVVALNAAVGAVPAVVGAVAVIDSAAFVVVGAATIAGASPVGMAAWGLAPLLIVLAVAPSAALSSSGLVALVRGTDEGELAVRGDVDRRLGNARFRVDVIVGVVASVLIPALLVVGWSEVWVQAILAPVVGIALLLRTRTFSHVRHVVPLLAAGAVGIFPVPFVVADWFGVSGVAAATLTVGVLTCLVVTWFAAGLSHGNDINRARVARVLDMLDAPVTICVVPVVFVAQGVYQFYWP